MFIEELCFAGSISAHLADFELRYDQYPDFSLFCVLAAGRQQKKRSKKYYAICELAHTSVFMQSSVLCNSDSCGICQGYDERVFSVPKFVKEANKRFVLAYLDSPRDESLAPANFKEQTSQARRLFGVDAAVPRFHILSSDGKRRFECRRFDDSKNQVRDFLDALERIADALAGIRGAEEAIAGLGGGNPAEAARIMRDALVKIDEETLGNYFVDDAEQLVRDNGAFLKDFPYLEFVHPLRKEFAAMRSEIIATAHARFRQRGVDYSYPRFKSFTKEIFDGGGYKEKFKDLLSRVDATKLRVSGRPQTAKSLLRLEKEIKATRSEFAGK